MAGHSKWTNIKHRKESQDKKKEKKFTKIIQKLKTISKIYKNDIRFNKKIRSIINQNSSINIPKNILKKAISNDNNIHNCKKIYATYEGYGPGGIAIIIECFIKNRNQITSKLRNSFSKFGGNLSTNGSVTYLFKKTVVITLPYSFQKNKIKDKQIIEFIRKSGAEYTKTFEKNKINIYTTKKNTKNIKNKLKSFGLISSSSRIINTPTVYLNVQKKYINKFTSLINTIQSFKEVKTIYHNGKFNVLKN
ncbi:MAG: putative transcriptional regulator YebC [Candidatus Westeberhardia cardiocondylae]|nr:putative transcriptional regulator YebC [Candidatus Westeberhardia cardiocondylae]